MSSCMPWITSNNVRVPAHLDGNNPACNPSRLGWIFVLVVNEFSLEDTTLFASLQGTTKIVSEKRKRMYGLIDTY